VQPIGNLGLLAFVDQVVDICRQPCWQLPTRLLTIAKDHISPQRPHPTVCRNSFEEAAFL
ncbi:MAG: hypothetical protein MR712_00965, partial [Bacteroidales bacterium]|nr:hypothetical protein [Bacteroidales bacterium]